MMAHGQEMDIHKRKRSPDDNGQQPSHPERIPQPPPPQSGATPINYLTKSSSTRLKLVHGDSDTFGDVISLLDQYEGVLYRHESFAANLGAKLTAPRLLKAMEGAFEGPIKAAAMTDCSFDSTPPTWLDIVKFAKTNPTEFSLTSTPDHGRVCQFFLNGYQIEITEDDWRLIMSGAMDRFLPVFPSPFEEDESAELATLEILEKRLQYLKRKADEVARKARQLNYHMSGRMAAISGRKSSQGQGGGFQAVNQPARSGPNPGYDLKADLLQQFLAPVATTASCNKALTSSVPQTPTIQSIAGTPKPPPSHQVTSRPSPAATIETGQSSGIAEDPTAVHRPVITARIEKMSKGDTIFPPCDRCRRLKVPCVKHLTACQGCTKKHAKCVWKCVTEEEVARILGQGGTAQPHTVESDVESRPLGVTTSYAQDSNARQGPNIQGTSNPDQQIQARGPGDIASILRQDEPPESATGSVIETTERGAQGLGISSRSQSSIRDHSLLSHMASVATAEAEARVAATVSDQPRTTR